MALGTPQTSEYRIGTAELRIAAMTNALRTTQADSVGVVDEVNIKVDQTKVELKVGFPKTLADSRITEISGKVSATLREATRKNISILLGNGVPANATPASSTIAADVALNATSVLLADATNFANGDIIVIYQDGAPETLSTIKVTGKTTNTLSFASGSVSTALLAANGTIKVFKSNGVPLGNSTAIQYFTASIIQQAADGSPTGFHIWKATASGGLDWTAGSSDYASFKLELDVLRPAVTDYTNGGPLVAHAASAAIYPFGMTFGSGI
jgi:hypothetical protein